MRKNKQLKCLPPFQRKNYTVTLYTQSHSFCVNEDVNMIVMQSISSTSFYLQCGGKSVSMLPLCLDVVIFLLGRHS